MRLFSESAIASALAEHKADVATRTNQNINKTLVSVLPSSVPQAKKQKVEQSSMAQGMAQAGSPLVDLKPSTSGTSASTFGGASALQSWERSRGRGGKGWGLWKGEPQGFRKPPKGFSKLEVISPFSGSGSF